MKKIAFILLLLARVASASTTESGQPVVTVSPQGTGAGATGEVRLKELTANGQNYVGWKAPDSLAASRIYTLPGADGTAGQVLSTNGSGVLSWSSSGGAGTVTNIATGTGLQGGPITTTGTIDLRLNAAGALTKTAGAGNELAVAVDGSTVEISSNALRLKSGGITASHIGDSQVTLAKIDNTIKGAAAGVYSLRTLGTLSTDACAGNDSRLSDTRTPTDGSVTTAKIADANVTAAKMTNSGVFTGDATSTFPAITIGTNAITTSKIAADAVTLAKLESRARPARNFIINGGMDHFQRTTPGTIANVTDGNYGPDRWVCLWDPTGAANSMRIERVDAASEGAQYACKVTPATTATRKYCGLLQKVEARDAIPLRSRSVTFQARIKMSAGAAANFRMAILEWTGTADTGITSDIVGDWSSSTFTEGNFFATSASYQIPTGGVSADISVSTSYTTASLTLDLGSTLNNLYVFVWCNESQDDPFEVTKLGLYDGNSTRDWLPRPAGEELALCQRRYRKSYDPDIAPGTATENGAVEFASAQAGSGTNYLRVCARYGGTMANSPTVTLYAPSTGVSAKIDHLTTSDTLTETTPYIGVVGSGVTGFYVKHSAASLYGIAFHFTADAEL
jgi:hypothetical protein